MAANYPNYNDIKQAQANGNYQYDAIGNLISDASEGISGITWNLYGKIQTITKANGTTIAYTYDAAGNRISKTVTIATVATTTWYVRDASGNVMSVYVKDATINSGHLTQAEVHLYGSSRLGIWNANTDVNAITTVVYSNYNSIFTRGNKLFELANHLGNVLVTVSDKTIAVPDPNNPAQTLYYTADVVTANDYYPFGFQMPGRKFTQANSSYRYGFNGKENDKDISEGVQDYGMRIYSERLGRFFTVDPFMAGYPYYTPYQFSGNTPIQAIDLDGGEPVGYSTSATFSHPGYEWQRTSNDVHVKSEMAGVWHKMMIKDADGKDWIVYRQETEDFIVSGDHVRIVPRVDFYYLDNNCNNTSLPSVKDGDGKFIGRIVPFNAQERIDANADSKIADGFGIAAFGTVAGIAAIEAGVGLYSLYKTIKNLDKDDNSDPSELLKRALKRQNLKKAPKELKEKWSDEDGYDYEVRIHDKDENAPEGSNSNLYRTLRVARRKQGVDENGQGNGWEYLDDKGNWHSVKDLKSGKDPDAVNDTHIPLKTQ